jgi:hypothetical protein
MERQETNDPRVRVPTFETEANRGEYTERYTVYGEWCYDGEWELGDEIDLDVKPGTPMSVIRSAAEFVLERDYEKGGRIHEIRQQFGFYM